MRSSYHHYLHVDGGCDGEDEAGRGTDDDADVDDDHDDDAAADDDGDQDDGDDGDGLHDESANTSITCMFRSSKWFIVMMFLADLLL